MSPRWFCVCVLVVASALAVFADGIPATSTPPDPRISVGGGSDAVPITSLNFTFFSENGLSGSYYTPGSPQDCELGAPGSSTNVPGCSFQNMTGQIINTLTVQIPTDMQFDVFDCTPSSFVTLPILGTVPIPGFHSCSEQTNAQGGVTAIVFSSSYDNDQDLDDIGLLPGQFFQISLAGGTGSDAGGWDANTPLSVAFNAPEPVSLALLALGLLLAGGLAAWRRRRAF